MYYIQNEQVFPIGNGLDVGDIRWVRIQNNVRVWGFFKINNIYVDVISIETNIDLDKPDEFKNFILTENLESKSSYLRNAQMIAVLVE